MQKAVSYLMQKRILLQTNQFQNKIVTALNRYLFSNYSLLVLGYNPIYRKKIYHVNKEDEIILIHCSSKRWTQFLKILSTKKGICLVVDMTFTASYNSLVCMQNGNSWYMIVISIASYLEMKHYQQIWPYLTQLS